MVCLCCQEVASQTRPVGHFKSAPEATGSEKGRNAGLPEMLVRRVRIAVSPFTRIRAIGEGIAFCQPEYDQKGRQDHSELRPWPHSVTR
jgi:hypothetical protein